LRPFACSRSERATGGPDRRARGADTGGKEWGSCAEFYRLVEQRDIDFARAPNVGAITETTVDEHQLTFVETITEGTRSAACDGLMDRRPHW
jgi:hypothetical protein